MEIIKRILNEIDGGRVLDVGTQAGHFVQVLQKNLNSYAEIVGIDIDEQAIDTARDRPKPPLIWFSVMNAEQIGFENESFDTVTISASLHHLSNISQVLGEMKRVLKPGGYFILVEMHSSGKTAAELTSIYLHQWVAEVDSALGHLHHKTLTWQDFESHVSALALSNVAYYEDRDVDTDPLEPSRIEQLENLITKTTQRMEKSGDYTKLNERGQDLWRRLHEVGAQREPIIMVVGQK